MNPTMLQQVIQESLGRAAQIPVSSLQLGAREEAKVDEPTPMDDVVNVEDEQPNADDDPDAK